MSKVLTIARNTFVETLRQPVYGVIIGTALLLFLLSPSLAMYTMDDDNKLLREIGLSTLFLTSLFVAIFSASGAVAGEMENKMADEKFKSPIKRREFIRSGLNTVAGLTVGGVAGLIIGITNAIVVLLIN